MGVGAGLPEDAVKAVGAPRVGLLAIDVGTCCAAARVATITGGGLAGACRGPYWAGACCWSPCAAVARKLACRAAASAATGAAGATVAVVCGALVFSKCRWTISRKHSILPDLQSCLGFVSLHVVTASLP